MTPALLAHLSNAALSTGYPVRYVMPLLAEDAGYWFWYAVYEPASQTLTIVREDCTPGLGFGFTPVEFDLKVASGLWL